MGRTADFCSVALCLYWGGSGVRGSQFQRHPIQYIPRDTEKIPPGMSTGWMKCDHKMQEMFKFMKSYYGKRHMAINRPSNTPSLQKHLIHRSGHFLKLFRKSSSVSVFCCVVVAASMSSFDSKHLHFIIILNLGKSEKSTVPDPANKVHEDTLMFL